MRVVFYIFILLMCHAAVGQESSEDDGEYAAAQLEDLSQDEETESENDYDLQQLQQYRKSPLNVNSEAIGELPLLDPLLIENLVTYRKLLGDIIDIHELQAVPGFTIDIIKRIIPFITVRKQEDVPTDMRQRLAKGTHSFLCRFAFTPEASAGFRGTSSQKFEGSRPAVFMRYKLQYRNLFQFGWLVDKDPGEVMLRNGRIADFSSFYVFARQIGRLKTVALGDYTINFGQGLIHWQNQAYKKSSSVISINRQGETLRPYQSAGEHQFHRGIAVTIGKGRWESTVFVSYRKISANVNEDSTGRKVITSILTSSLHRTASENLDRKVSVITTAGSNIRWLVKRGHASVNLISSRYGMPIDRADHPYNHFALAGKNFTNASIDYTYTYRNFHLFGELAVNQELAPAAVAGAMTSLSGAVDLAMLYRDISRSYTSIYGNAFTENLMPVNERGFYSGISIKPRKEWRIDIYADVFSFPWMKYRLDAPSDGIAYLIQVTCKPNRQTEIFSRYRYRIKPLNIENEEIEFPGQQFISNWRSQVSCQVTPYILLRSRIEWCFFDTRFLEFPGSGYLFFTEAHFKPRHSWLSGSFRLQAFEADSYNTRIYAYENDLLFVSSTPSYYNNGVRYYINIKAKMRGKWLRNRSLTLSLKAASTVYTNISTIGTGLSEIAGNRQSSLKLQLFLTE